MIITSFISVSYSLHMLRALLHCKLPHQARVERHVRCATQVCGERGGRPHALRLTHRSQLRRPQEVSLVSVTAARTGAGFSPTAAQCGASSSSHNAPALSVDLRSLCPAPISCPAPCRGFPLLAWAAGTCTTGLPPTCTNIATLHPSLGAASWRMWISGWQSGTCQRSCKRRC